MSVGTEMAGRAVPRIQFPFRDATVAVVVSLAAVATLLVALEIAVLVLTSARTRFLTDGGEFTLEHFEYVFTSRLFAPVLWNTLVVGLGSIAVMFVFAIPMAWLYARTDLPWKQGLIVFLTAKVAMPGFLVAMGYILLFNRSNGLINQALKNAFGLQTSVFNVYTVPWIILLQGIALASPCFFMLVPSFMAIDSSLEESGRVSGLTQRTVTTRISVPLVFPAIIASAIYFFITEIEGFDYPAMLGVPTRTFVLSTWMYLLISSSSGVPQYGEAAAVALLVSAAAGSLSLLYYWATRQAGRYSVVTGKRRAPVPTTLSRPARRIAWSFIGLYGFIGLALPLVTLIWQSITPFPRLPSAEAFASLSVGAYREALHTMGNSMTNSIVLMLAAPTVSVLFGLAVTWVVTRTKIPGRKALDVLIMAAVAIPSTVVALAFLCLGLWSYWLIPIYGTIWLVILAMGVRQTTWAHRAISSAALQVHREIEEAGAVSGIQRGRVMLSILVPVIRPALIFSWFWIALLSLRELAIPIMLFSPDTRVLSTSIWQLSTSGNQAVASAMGVMLLAIITLLVVVFHRIAGKTAI